MNSDFGKERNLRIIGPPSKEYLSVLRWCEVNSTQLFANDIFLPLWIVSVQYQIDPVGVIAQSFKETGGGKFGGKVTPKFYNTCGLKVRHMELFPGITDGDNPLAHQMFPSWPVGATAHVQHVCAYAGWEPEILDKVSIVDPRWDGVFGKHALEDWSEFGNGRWAPSPTYGQEIESIMSRIKSFGS
jgi:hypothetical protein